MGATTGGTGAGGTGAGGPGAGGTGGSSVGGATQPLQRRPFLWPQPQSSLPPPSSIQLQPDSPLPAPSPYTELTDSQTECREPASHLASPVCTVRRARRVCPTPVPGTYTIALRPSSIPQRVAMPSPPSSSLPDLALGSYVLEDRQFELECFASAVPHLAAMLLVPEGDPDALDIMTPRSYAEAISDSDRGSTSSRPSPPPRRRPLFGCYCTLHHSVHSLDFSTAFLQGNLHEEIWLCRPPHFTGSVPEGTKWSLWRPFYGLHQAPREWHDTLRMTLAALGFAPLTADPSLFLRTDPSLSLFYIIVYVNDMVFATADTEAPALVKAELQKRHTCTDLGELRSYLGLQITQDRAARTITLT
ncbi:unnamed protein product [Closterium sp. NIES-54]